jgi:hypothetical protein
VDGAPAGVAFALDRATVALASGASAQVTVTMSASRAAPAGGKQALLRVSEGGAEVAHAALFAHVR